jgi:hypothetical protein
MSNAEEHLDNTCHDCKKPVQGIRKFKKITGLIVEVCYPCYRNRVRIQKKEDQRRIRDNKKVDKL